MVILETNRLLLKEADLNDGAFFLVLLTSPDWIKYIGDSDVNSVADAKRYIKESLIRSYTKNGFGLYKMILKEEEIPIGVCGLLKRPYLNNPDIGFAILPEYMGNGYSYEAAKATIEYGTAKLELKKIVAITSKENVRSKALLEKIGLKYTDTIKPEGDKTELLLYSN